MTLLRLEKVNVSYDALHVLRDVSLEIEKGTIVALIGLNGAGKTTTLKTIMGALRPTSGRILLEDDDIAQLPSHRRVEKGISLVPEGRELFYTLTVKENLLLGAYARRGDVEQGLRRVHELFPILKERQNQHAGTLSGGEQQMLAVGRGLMSDPKLLMLDELSLGLAPSVVDRLYETVSQINSQGVTILLVEQHVDLALKVADFAYGLEMGEVTFRRRSQDLLKDETIKKAYLG